MHFNPRPRKEGDQAVHLISQTASSISIHALVKRATKIKEENSMTISISIHALVKRATDDDGEEKGLSKISIHALVKRATLSALCRLSC